MLILSRNEQESLVIADNIKVTVLRTTNGQVSLGIEAPRSIDVHRQEVYERIQRTNG
jgi:carbon storage regulator